MPRLDANWIKKQLGVTANTCTITTRSISHGTDEYRLETVTTVNYTNITCQVQILTEEDDSVKQGDDKAEDMIFYFASDQESKLANGNNITFDSKVYRIYDVKKFDRISTTYVIECRTRKI